MIRLEQYKSALEFYIGCHEVSNIILCDNSNSINSDFSKEKEKAKAFRKKLEILYIHTNEYMISQYGKGYGEAEILDYVISHSKLLTDNDMFLKVTGRLILCNVDALIKQAINCKFKTDIIINKCGNHSVDSRFFISKVSIYKELFCEAKFKVNDHVGRYLENVYYDIIVSQNLKSTCFSRFPRVSGQSGSLGYYYNDNTWKRRIKLLWRDLLSTFNYYKVK